jgi:hypothetical protein
MFFGFFIPICSTPGGLDCQPLSTLFFGFFIPI